MKKNILLFIVLFINSLIIAQESSQWIRYAAISPDGENIAFTFKGDLYIVPSSGGDARAITFNQAHDFMPVWSSDGTKISFASNRFGNFDIFLIDASGGEPLRLTYHSSAEYPYSFSSDNKSVIFGGQRLDAVTNRLFPTGSQPEVYQVSVSGSRVNQV